MFQSFKLYQWLNITPLIVSVIMVLFILIFGKILPPKLPLFYSLAWGENQLVTQMEILIVPAIITIVALLNMFLSWQLHPSQIFFKRALICSSLLMTLILAATYFKVMFIFI